MLICGATVICTRQKSTATGVRRPGGVKVFAGSNVAAMEVTSGRCKADRSVQASAKAGEVPMAANPNAPNHNADSSGRSLMASPDFGVGGPGPNALYCMQGCGHRVARKIYARCELPCQPAI